MSKNISLLTYKDLEGRGYGSRVTLWRKVRDNEFPPPVKLGGRTVWRESDVIEFFESLHGVS